MSEKQMEAIEIAAASLEEATVQAAAQLGVGRDQVVVTVIDESKGLFGKGQVRVKAEIKAGPAEPTKKPRTKKATKEAEKAPQEAVVEVKSENGDDEASDAVASEADGEKIVGLLQAMLDGSGLQVSVKVSELTGKYVNVALGGRDVSYLVGRRGEVLNALQYLMNVIVSRQLDNGVRVVVDGDEYRRRRQEVLEKQALDIAAEVKKRGEEAVLDALPAFERRVIHQALADYDGVTTYSEGEEPDRRVVIAPSS